jgi:hypothetical protein
MFKTIDIDHKRLTIMGVRFFYLKTLGSIAYAIGSNMFEGFESISKGVEIFSVCL